MLGKSLVIWILVWVVSLQTLRWRVIQDNEALSFEEKSIGHTMPYWGKGYLGLTECYLGLSKSCTSCLSW